MLKLKNKNVLRKTLNALKYPGSQWLNANDLKQLFNNDSLFRTKKL